MGRGIKNGKWHLWFEIFYEIPGRQNKVLDTVRYLFAILCTKRSTVYLLPIEQRNQIRKTLLLDFSVSKNNHPLREFLRSDRGEYDEVLDKSDIQILLLKESLKLQHSETEKVDTVIEFMKSDHFKSKEELSNLLQAVKEEDDKLLVKIYETISQ